MRTITLADPALTTAPTAWITARAELMARASELRARVTPGAGEESQDAAAGTLGDEELMTEDAKPEAGPDAGPVGPRSYLDRERSRRARAAEAGEVDAEAERSEVDAEVERAGAGAAAKLELEPEPEPELVREPEQEREADEPEILRETKPNPATSEPESGHMRGTGQEQGDPGPERVPAMPISQLSYLDRERAERRRRPEVEEVADGPGPDESEAESETEAESEVESETEAEAEVEARPAEQRPLLRKERALDPDWIGARPLFRDEAPTRPLPRIEFEPSEGADAAPPRKTPRIASMRSVVLGAQADQAVAEPLSGAGPEPDPDPPTLIDRMPPIDPDDLVVPEFLRPDFIPPMASLKPSPNRPPLPQRQRRPRPAPAPGPAPTPATGPAPAAAAPAPATTAATSTPVPAPAPASAPAPADIAVPDFIVPGFTEPAPEPPLRTVLSTVLGPELWQRCYAEWSPAHCTALARIARIVDGLAPSAGAAVRSTAGAGMRWLGVAREREMLADQVADAISHPAGATAPNQARTVRLYGAAICVALNVPLRRCACHRDLERDVSGELIRLGLEELAGEVP